MYEYLSTLRVTGLNLSGYPQCGHYIPGQAVQVHRQAAQVPGQTAQVPGVGGAGSKTGAEPAPRIGLLRCSGGAGFGPKMEPAPSGASGLFRNSPQW